MEEEREKNAWCQQVVVIRAGQGGKAGQARQDKLGQDTQPYLCLSSICLSIIDPSAAVRELSSDPKSRISADSSKFNSETPLPERGTSNLTPGPGGGLEAVVERPSLVFGDLATSDALSESTSEPGAAAGDVHGSDF